MLGVKTAALPASLRRTNERTVISLLLRMGSASRADLAKVAGISQPTAGKITAELIELGILRELGSAADTPSARGSPRLGRPGQMLQLDGERPRFLALELGVTETCMSALPVAVKLQDEWAVAFPTPATPEAWLEEFKRASAKLRHSPLWGALVSVPGIVDESAGKSLFCPNLHWLEKSNLPKMVQQVWNCPVLLVQEIRALALGHLTAEPGGEDFLLVDFGQGVGGAIVQDGKLYTHPIPLSGEVGHTPVPANLRHCGCGAVGCLETLVSQRGLRENFAAAHRAPLPSWKALVRHVSEHGLEPWLGEALEAAAKVIDGALNVLGIRRVVLTGILTEFPEPVLEHLSAEIKKGALWGRFGEVVCQFAPHRRAAGLVAVGLDRLVLPASHQNGVLPRRGRGRKLS